MLEKFNNFFASIFRGNKNEEGVNTNIQENKVSSEKPSQSSSDMKVSPQSKAKTTSTKKEKHEDFFGVSLDLVGVGDRCKVTIDRVDESGAIATVNLTNQEICINQADAKGLSLGEEVELIIYRQKDGSLYGRKFQPVKQQKNSKAQKNILSLREGEIITAKVKEYKDPFFVLEYKGNRLNVLKYHIDCSPILDYEDYVGNKYDFMVKSIDENKKTGKPFIYLSRKELVLKERMDKVKDFQIGEKFELKKFTKNDAGLESLEQNVRVFVPYSRIDALSFVDEKNVDEFIKVGTELTIINKVDDTLVCEPVREEVDPEAFFEQDHTGKSYRAKIINVYDYGVLCKLASGNRGLIAFNDLDNQKQEQLRKLDSREIISVSVKELNKEDKKIYFDLV